MGSEMCIRDRYQARFETKVELVEALGNELIVHGSMDAETIDSGDPDATEEVGEGGNFVGRFDPRSRVRAGDMAQVAVNLEKLHFFDATTRESIWA